MYVLILEWINMSRGDVSVAFTIVHINYNTFFYLLKIQLHITYKFSVIYIKIV